MTWIDWSLIFLGLGIIGFLTYQRMARALFTLAVLWASTLASALLYGEGAYRVKAIAGKNPTVTEGVVFIVLFVLFTVAGYIIVHSAFPITRLPKIGFLDYVMGFLLGALVAVIIISMLLNAVGVMARQQWDNYSSWVGFNATYRGCALRPISRQVLSIYHWAFVPFFPQGLPPILAPQ